MVAYFACPIAHVSHAPGQIHNLIIIDNNNNIMIIVVVQANLSFWGRWMSCEL